MLFGVGWDGQGLCVVSEAKHEQLKNIERADAERRLAGVAHLSERMLKV